MFCPVSVRQRHRVGWKQGGWALANNFKRHLAFMKLNTGTESWGNSTRARDTFIDDFYKTSCLPPYFSLMRLLIL